MKNKTEQYMAGLFDAEGCFTINAAFRSKSNCLGYTAQIILTNTNLQLLKWIVKHFGGVVKVRKAGKNKQAYDWKVTNQKHALSFISAIKPYLIVKKSQASIMEAYYSLNGKEDPKTRKILCAEIKRLKHIGSVTTEMPDVQNSNAYYAGFVDGDGHISKTPILHAFNTNKAVINSFCEKYGGSIRFRPLSDTNPNWLDEHSWSIGDKYSVQRILLAWLPYLIDKRENALNALNKLRDKDTV